MFENQQYENMIKQLEDAIEETATQTNYEINRMQNAHKNEIMMIHNFIDDIQVQYDKVEQYQRDEELLKAELQKFQSLLE
jgi:hypothetical protein